MAARRLLKTVGIVAIVIIIGIIALIVFRVTYAFQIFSFETSSNEPTLPRGRILFTSNLKEPNRFDFIAFNNKTQPGSSIWMFRVCGLPGDSVEIRSGDLFVNGRAVDASFTLSHSYIIPVRDTAGVKRLPGTAPLIISEDSALIIVPDDEIKRTKVYHSRYTLPQEVADAQIEKVFGQPWNIDHFGPVAVPKDSYFLLGDSRTSAVDSRYFGFVAKKDFRGTLLFR
jgi:signal peptidase I